MPEDRRGRPGDDPPHGRASRAGAILRDRWRRYVASPTLRLATLLARGHAVMYVAVASLIGADAAAAVLGAATIWPVGIPILLAALVATYWLRRLLGRIARTIRAPRPRWPPDGRQDGTAGGDGSDGDR